MSLRARARIGHRLGDVLRQHLLQGGLEIIRCQQEGDRARENDDLLGGLLDLPHALEIADRRGDVFDADAEQGRGRDPEQLRELGERVDLRQLAALEPVERRTRDPDLPGDLVRAQPRAHAKGLEPLADLLVAERHRSSPGSNLRHRLQTDLSDDGAAQTPADAATSVSVSMSSSRTAPISSLTFLIPRSSHQASRSSMIVVSAVGLRKPA